MMSGAVYRQGLPDQPIRTVVPYADFGTALTLTIGVMMALYHRDRTGEGQHVEGALLRTALMLSNAFLIERELLQIDKPRMGNKGASVAPCDLYRTADNEWVLLQVAGRPMFKRWCRLVEREDLLDDPRFADDDLRWHNGDVLNDIMATWCADKTKAQVLELLESAKMPAAPLHSTQDVLDDPHIEAMGYLRRVPFPGPHAPCRSSTPRSGCRRGRAASAVGPRYSASTPTRCSPRSATAHARSSSCAPTPSSDRACDSSA